MMRERDHAPSHRRMNKHQRQRQRAQAGHRALSSDRDIPAPARPAFPPAAPSAQTPAGYTTAAWSAPRRPRPTRQQATRSRGSIAGQSFVADQAFVAGLVHPQRLAPVDERPLHPSAPHHEANAPARQDERPEKINLLQEAVQRVPSGMGLVFEMLRDAGERLVMDETGPEKRIVQRLVEVPGRRHRHRAAENDCETGDTDRLEARQHEYGQRRDDERNSTGQSLAQDRETAGHARPARKSAGLRARAISHRAARVRKKSSGASVAQSRPPRATKK